MGNLLLNVGLLGGIWNFISGTIGKIGAALSSSFVPVADTIWASTMGVVKAVPAFCVAHPGAVILGAVSLFAGVKLVKGIAKKFKEMKSKVKVAIATRQAEKQAEAELIQQAAAVKVKEVPAPKAKAPEKAKSAKPAKNSAVVALESYIANRAAEDSLKNYMEFRQERDAAMNKPASNTHAPVFNTLYRPVDNSVFTADYGMDR